MAELIVESDASGEATQFSGSSADLVYFLSFAVAERYGATHDLAVVARTLRQQHAVNLRPLLSFAEDNAPDPDDQRDMDQIWQESGPVRDSARAAAAAIRSSPSLQELAKEFPALVDGLEELGRIAAEYADRGSRLRLLFRL